MIGTISFLWAGSQISATLEDRRSWSCGVKGVDIALDILAPPGSGYLPAGGQLRLGAEVMGGRVAGEEKAEEPGAVF